MMEWQCCNFRAGHLVGERMGFCRVLCSASASTVVFTSCRGRIRSMLSKSTQNLVSLRTIGAFARLGHLLSRPTPPHERHPPSRAFSVTFEQSFNPIAFSVP